jgi:hypothetical protein
MISPIAVAIGILSVVTASPTSRYVVHEKREIGNSAWVPVEAKLNGRTTIPLSIGLTQRNLEKGHDFLMDVSDPTSPNYGKHWTPEQVRLGSIITPRYGIQCSRTIEILKPPSTLLGYEANLAGCRNICTSKRDNRFGEGLACREWYLRGTDLSLEGFYVDKS